MDQPARSINPRSFCSLVDEYRQSPEYEELAVGTKRDYDRYLTQIVEGWGQLSVAGLRPSHVLKVRDKRRSVPAAANALLRVLSVLISWSIPRGYRNDNPCSHVRKLSIGDGWSPWPVEMIHLIQREGPTWMWEATALALYTGQRQSDVLAMNWSALQDGCIQVRQAKTGKLLRIPAHSALLESLAGIPKTSIRILTSSRGAPWTADGFRSSWAKSLRGPLAPIREKGLVFHGLRKSAVVTLLEAGCTDAEVGAITGQSRQMVEHYAREVNQRKLAASGISKWERAENVSLQNSGGQIAKLP